MAHRRFLSFCVLASALLCSTVLIAQGVAPAVRIVDRVDDRHLVMLRGNTNPAANAHNDKGRVSPDLPMTGLTMVLSRSPEQQAAFDKFVASQYDLTSPNFHHWLEPDEVGQMFGPATSDIAAITAWLTGQGFSVDELSKDHMLIRFSGTAALVESAFHTEIHNLEVKGEQHIGNMTDPQIPAALAPAVVGVKALHNFFARPLHHLGSLVTQDPTTKKWQRISGTPATATSFGAAASPAGVRPEFGINVPGANAQLIEDVAPYDFAAIYNVLPLWNAGIDGTGQTIAIAGTSSIDLNDVVSFRTIFGLPTTGPANTPEQLSGNLSPLTECTTTASGVPFPNNSCGINDLVENTLDVEWAGAVAKNAQIVLVSSYPLSATDDGLFDSENYIISHNTAKIMNVSYGLCELGMGNTGNAAYNTLWQTAASQGIAVFVASGDSGAAGCDAGYDNAKPFVPYGAQFGLSVSGYSSTPYNTAVGGTDFTWCAPTATTACLATDASSALYWNAANSTTTGASAKGYVPETPWNDSCASPQSVAYLETVAAAVQVAGVTDAETACNFVNTYWTAILTQYNVDLSGFVDITGAGGGKSACTTSTGGVVSSCSGGYAKPSWQTGVTGIPADGKRDVPDVSFFASNGMWSSAYLMCVSAQGACVTSTTITTKPSLQEIGGTSVGTPAMAGVMALINQKAGSTQGLPNSGLYTLAAAQTYASCSAETGMASSTCYFNDVDTGNIAVPCQAGSPDCTVTTAADPYGILSGYSAAVGFDLATGLGSLNVANVVNHWPSPNGPGATTVTVVPASTSLTRNLPLNVTVTVASSPAGGATPTGTVTLFGGGYTSAAATLASGSATITIPANSLSSGSDTLTATYSGNPTYASKTGTASVTVTLPTPTVAVVPVPTTVGPATPVAVGVTVSGSGGPPTGTATLSGGGYTSTACTLASGACTITIPANSLTNGTDTLTVIYSGDTNFAPATGTATVTVHIFTPTVTVSPLSSDIPTATVLPGTVTITGTSGVATGSVTITAGSYNSGTQALTAGVYNFTIPAGSLLAGTDTITANYTGDTTYVAATGSATVTVTKQTPTMTVTPSATTLFTNQPLTVSGTVTGAGATATGTVTLTGGGYTSTAQTLASGAYSFTIPAGSLAAGVDVLTVSYIGDANFTAASKTTTVTVTTFVPLTPTVTVTPASTTLNSGASLSVTAAVTGTGATPSGTVTLSGGGYTSTAQTLTAGGVFVFTIPANSLSAGADVLTVSYSGDGVYSAKTGTTTVTVTRSTFTLAAAAATAIATPGGTTTSLVTVTGVASYTGTVTLTCALTTSPTGAQFPPNCSSGSGMVTLSSTATTGTATVMVSTTPAISELIMPGLGNGKGWAGARVGAILALLMFFGIPARRRSWRSMLGVLVAMAVLGSLSGCGGGGGGGTKSSGTTLGSYTFTVTGTGSPSITPVPTTTFTVTVN